MMRDNSRVAGPKGPQDPIRRRGMFQSLMLSAYIALLALGIAASICYGDEQHSRVGGQSRDEAASPQADASHEEHEHANRAYEFSLIRLAEPTGILTLSLVALTVCLGVLRRVRRLRPRLILKLHKIVGFCVLGSGAIHATIVLLTH